MFAALRFRRLNPQAYEQSKMKLKGPFYYIAPIIGLLLSVIIIAILLVDLSAHEYGMLFMVIFIGWTAGGAVYAAIKLRKQ